MTIRNAARIAAIAAVTMMAAGCATPPPADDPEALAEFHELNDPLEPMNRSIFEFNQALDRAVIKPAAQGYRDTVPEFGRDRVSDFLGNLSAPVVFFNDVMQGEIGRAGTTLGRFVLNSTFGVLGIMDVAEPMGLERHSEDFGQTLAVWGVPEGPYLMLPLLGPSNPRDGVGKGVDMMIDPVGWWASSADAQWVSPSRAVVGGIDTREQYLDLLDEIERSSLDYYASIRSLYRQNRMQEIRNRPDNAR